MHHHAQTGAIVIAAGTLAAGLPDPHRASIILFLAGIGALIGAAIGRVRRLPRELIRELAEDWSFAGGLFGTILYLAALVGLIDHTMHWTDNTLGGLTALLAVAVAGAVVSVGRPHR
jgi:hypothetical protein